MQTVASPDGIFLLLAADAIMPSKNECVPSHPRSICSFDPVSFEMKVGEIEYRGMLQ